MKVRCNASDRCPNIFCNHARLKGHDPVVVNVHTGALCTEPSECATFARMVSGVGAKRSVCQCVPIEEEEER